MTLGDMSTSTFRREPDAWRSAGIATSSGDWRAVLMGARVHDAPACAMNGGSRRPATHAALLAAALELPVGASMMRRVALERLAEHLQRVLVLWPGIFGWRGGPQTLRPHDVAAVRCALFGSGEAPRDVDALERWLESADTAPARVLRPIWRGWDARWGRAALPLLTDDTPPETVDWAEAEIDGRAVENTVGARLADRTLMRGVEARRGRGVCWRLVAALLDCADLLDAVDAPFEARLVMAHGPGLASAPVSDGAILLRVCERSGRIEALARVTPADCLRHRDGLLARMRVKRPPAGDHRAGPFDAAVRLSVGAPPAGAAALREVAM